MSDAPVDIAARHPSNPLCACLQEIHKNSHTVNEAKHICTEVRHSWPDLIKRILLNRTSLKRSLLIVWGWMSCQISFKLIWLLLSCLLTNRIAELKSLKHSVVIIPQFFRCAYLCSLKPFLLQYCALPFFFLVVWLAKQLWFHNPFPLLIFCHR